MLYVLTQVQGVRAGASACQLLELPPKRTCSGGSILRCNSDPGISETALAAVLEGDWLRLEMLKESTMFKPVVIDVGDEAPGVAVHSFYMY